MSSDLVASDDGGIKPAFVDDSAQVLVLPAVAEYIPFGSISSMLRVPPHTLEEIQGVFTEYMSHLSAATDNVVAVEK